MPPPKMPGTALKASTYMSWSTVFRALGGPRQSFRPYRHCFRGRPGHGPAVLFPRRKSRVRPAAPEWQMAAYSRKPVPNRRHLRRPSQAPGRSMPESWSGERKPHCPGAGAAQEVLRSSRTFVRLLRTRSVLRISGYPGNRFCPSWAISGGPGRRLAPGKPASGGGLHAPRGLGGFCFAPLPPKHRWHPIPERRSPHARHRRQQPLVG